MKEYEPGTVLGARLGVSLPVGDYDNTKAINLGTNRWSIAGELGMATPLGRWSIEAMLGARVFTTNDEFLGSLQLEQDPLLIAKLHLVRPIRAGFWWALAMGYGYGAGTAIEGIPRATTQKNWRVFAMVAYPITPQQGVSVSIGSGGNYGAGTDFDALTVGYQYSWGGS